MLRLRIRNFRLELSYPFIALCAFVAVGSAYTGYLFCALAVIIHELGHLAAMRACGVRADGMRITAFNIIINERDRHGVSSVRDFIITLAGPLANLTAYGVLLPFSSVFALVNLFIGLFNLLPVSGLDGGQLVYLALVRRLSPRGSAIAVDSLTFIISLPLFAVGILVLFESKYNFSLLFLSIYLILNVFFKKGKYV